LRFGALRRAVRTALYGDAAITVLTGPFRGLRYFDRHVWGLISNKWLGSYECELHPVIEAVQATPYRRVLDIGCAEGWYIAGLAASMPSTQFIGFDIDPLSLRQTRELVTLNGCQDRVSLPGECRHADLDVHGGEGTLVICDIEGFEEALLDPQHAPALRRSDILVEVHEASGESRALSTLLRSRFESTHRIQVIEAIDRSAWVTANRAHLPAALSTELAVQAADEHRPQGNHWLWMKAH
jgi:hypothetical protein